MAHAQSIGSRSVWATPAITALALVLLAMLVQGQDANWDLRNYHFYTPSALLDGRLEGDIAAAQLQTWHNPTLDLPFAWMVRAGFPGWLISLWLALPAFVALMLGLRLLDMLWPTARSAFRTAVAGLAAVSGAAVMPSIGTTFNDAFVGAGVLAAVWWGLDSHARRPAWAVWLPMGLLAGLVTGLKLTGSFYCLGFAAAALVAGSLRTAPARMLALATGGVLGVLMTGGPWAFYLWQEHGNPTFPYFNQWFQSPDASLHSHKDEKFIPHGWDAWLVPLHLLSDSRRFSEGRLADPRLLLGFVALTVWWMQGWRQRIGAFPVARVRLCLWVFMAASFFVWVKLYGIYRYLFALELICSVCMIGVVTQWRPSRFPRTLLVVAVLVVIALTNPPGWGRNSFSTPMVDVRLPPIPPDALVVQANDHPLGYAAAFLPRTVPAVSIRNNFMEPTRCTRLQSRAEARIRMHEGPLYLLRELREHPGGEEAYRAYGLSMGGACLPVYSNLSRLELCPLARMEATPVLCPSRSPGR